MKKLLLALLLVAFTAPCLFAQNPAVREFIREHRKGEENVALTVPGWLIGLAGEVGQIAAEDEEERVLFALAQEFGTIRLLTFETGDFNTEADVKALLKAIERHHGYERWASMRMQSGELMQLSVMQKKGAVREMVAIVSETEENRTIFAHFKMDVTPEELGLALNELMKED